MTKLKGLMAGGLSSYARVDAEIASGRFWRAKQILSGRLKASDYDPELFARYGDVAAAMRDDDEAGRYYFLAGLADGPQGDLARAFLHRRRSHDLRLLWLEMPGAARRFHETGLPSSTRNLLADAGYDLVPLAKLSKDLASSRNHQSRKKKAESRLSTMLAFMFIIAYFSIMLLGVIKVAELIRALL